MLAVESDRAIQLNLFDYAEPQTRTIPLTQGAEAIVDACDYDYLSQWKWHLGGSGYAIRSQTREKGEKPQPRIRMQTIWMHRLILELHKINFEFVDHRDQNRLNNALSNLRPCSQKENARNVKRRSHNTSEYKGAHFDKRAKKWRARIVVDGIEIFLGCFDTSEIAAVAYNEAALEYFGEFACLNKVSKNAQLAYSDTKNSKVFGMQQNNTSGYRGVSFDKEAQRWKATIQVASSRKTLGRFNTPELAAIAYNEAALKYHGDSAYLNEIPGEKLSLSIHNTTF